MSSRPNWRLIELDLRMAEQTARTVEQRMCEKVVSDWNVRVQVNETPDPCPSIGLAVVAGYRFLHVFCPGCKTVSKIDLVQLDRHPETKLSALIPKLSCRSCPGGAPFAKLRGVTRE